MRPRQQKTLVGPLVKSALIFALVMGAFGVIFEMRNRDADEIEAARLRLYANQVSRRFEQQLTSRVGVLEYLAKVMPALDLQTYEQFSHWARPIREGIQGFDAINYVNTQNRIQWVEPLEANNVALGRSPYEREGVGAYLDAAASTHSPRLTHFLQLFRGKPGFVVYVPMYQDGVFRGFINGVFILDAFMRNVVVPESAFAYKIVISSGNKDAPIFSTGQMPKGNDFGRAETTVYGQQITVEVRPAAAGNGIDVANALLIAGGVIAALLIAGISFLLLRSKERLRYRLESERFQGTLTNLLVHDILNPLLVVRYSVDAANKIAPLEVRQKLAKTYYGLDQLHDVIKRVRDLAAVELGKAKMMLERVPINDLLNESLQAFEPRLKEKGILSEFQAAPENPPILVDRVIFQNNVINNVLSNALKFSEPGTRLRVAAKPRHGQVAITIADQGVGMSEEVLKDLFDERIDLTRPGTRGEQGTGIGMLQIRSYMRFFGGRVAVESRPKGQNPRSHGTTVSLFVPTAGDSSQKISPSDQ